MHTSRWQAPRVPDVLGVLALIALFVAQFHPFLTERLNLAAFQDNVYLLSPLFHHVAGALAHGEQPYWMDSIVGGVPLYDNPQFSLTYPFYFFRLLDYSTPLQAMLSLHRLSLLHLAILLANSFVMLRVMRLPAWPAALSASLIAFSPNMVDFAGWTNAIAPYAWFPLVVAAVILIADAERTVLGVLMGGAALALLCLASPAHALIHIVYFGAVLQVANLVRRARARDRRAVLRSTGALLLMGLVALVLAAPGVLPSVLHKDRMVRFGATEDGTPPFDEFLVGQLLPSDLAATLLPLDVPVVTGRSFLGGGAVLLALLGLGQVRRHWFLPPVALIGAYALASATGDHLGLARVNYQLPLINLIREPPRHLILFVICCAILAGFGVAELYERARARRSVLEDRWMWGCLAALGLLYALALHSALELRPEIDPTRFFGGVGLSLVLFVVGPALGPRLGGATLGLGGLVLVLTNMQYPMDVALMEDSDLFKPENRASLEVLEELSRLPDARDYRFYFEGGALNQQFWHMNASFYGLRGFEAYLNPLPRQQFEELFGRADLPHYYPLLGGKYHVCEACDPAALAGYTPVRRIGSETLYVNEDALPRYAVLSRVAGTYADTSDFFKRIRDGFDSHSSVYLPESEGGSLAAWLGASQASCNACRAIERGRSLNHLELDVIADRRALLLLNEYFTPHWRVLVNGVPAAVQRVNLNQIGVAVEAGTSRLAFEYRPRLYIALLQLQRLGVLALAACALAAAWRGVRR